MTQRRLILGTAGHIDHGKTALVKALTGVDTDRLQEEQARGITIELGFAELAPNDDISFGVVDVPGHEAFIRNMVAGATGVDLVLLVIAADEGVMPQTREHLSIVRLLGVERMAVALTKSDLVEEEWLELVTDEVKELLDGTPLQGSPIIPTSTVTGDGLEALVAQLVILAAATPPRTSCDVARLPVDRVFTVQGTGTVVTGTLWSGELRTGELTRLLPGALKARIRGLQVHGSDRDTARSGERTAVALVGGEVSRETLDRGQVLVSSTGWDETHMLTCHVSVLPSTGWQLAHNQRVRVHLGTSEVMARVAVLEGEVLEAGGEGWVQLRLEAPIVARARDRVVIRSYSPMTTIAGGIVAEPLPTKRRHLDGSVAALLLSVVADPCDNAVQAALSLAGTRGLAHDRLPILCGFTPPEVDAALQRLLAAGALGVGERIFGAEVVEDVRARVRESVADFHRRESLRPGIPIERLRGMIPSSEAPLVDAVVDECVTRGLLNIRSGAVSARDFTPVLSAAQEAFKNRLLAAIEAAGLTPPTIEELPDELRQNVHLWSILRLLESEGSVIALEDGLFVGGDHLREVAAAVLNELGGRNELGPADFKELIPVTRKHLIPILSFLDSSGITRRVGGGRDVTTTAPEGWPITRS